MNQKIELPACIKEIVKNDKMQIDNIGCSDSQVIFFDNYVLKIEKEREESNNEHIMLQWLQDKLSVPYIYVSHKENDNNYLLMSKLKGQMAYSNYWLQRPKQQIHLLAEGLKLLWAVDIRDCPYQNNIKNKLRLAKYRIENGLSGREDCEPETYGNNGFESPSELLTWLVNNQPEEELVFSHGDYCPPNIFISDNKISGFIDLGRAGIADKWQDIALCVRSIGHNYGKDSVYTSQLFEELGIKANWEKINYYILLDELF
ncbi:APH(3') family aminoglycoside O-phosphotransferase [Anaerocolumna sedimenticola]|uniref:APH(3') family aminoglycoside O-phosphotransferase n=1 Tax=Anaerocolumna sedimenticola TaxID=2696063 RepID=A0A6P1TRM6_9FIRM|nr:APH(3') family aminoglycoside O-phosphotransferase [Anaerocolumna sedimenticola]QHQ62909.1 APH(3') family aminoglycoside O-phosphotransferase [Anaerocolumna sedimenticola]